MKRFGKIALGAVMLAGAATALATPASAAVGVTLGVGPAYYGPPAGAVCDPYSRFYDPYYCNGYYGYYGPSVTIGGILDKDIPGLLANSNYEMFKGMSLKTLASLSEGRLTDQTLAQTKVDLAALPKQAFPANRRTAHGDECRPDKL